MIWFIFHRRHSGHPWLFVFVCFLLVGAIMAGAWVYVVLLLAWALMLIARGR